MRSTTIEALIGSATPNFKVAKVFLALTFNVAQARPLRRQIANVDRRMKNLPIVLAESPSHYPTKPFATVGWIRRLKGRILITMLVNARKVALCNVIFARLGHARFIEDRQTQRRQDLHSDLYFD